MLLKMHAATFRGIKYQKRRRNCGAATFPILRLGVQHVVETPFFAISLGFFPGNMRAVSDGQGEKFYRDVSRTGKGTSSNGTQPCWLITAGHLYWRHEQKTTRDKRRQNEFLMVH
jgi:hypothetical protein